jgi:LacI family transcriptional regulator
MIPGILWNRFYCQIIFYVAESFRIFKQVVFLAVTINEIAKLANVSKSTVSRVMNKSGPVSKQTQEAVLSAIASVNYRPSPIARGLTLRKTNTIGLILQDIRNPYYAHASWHVEQFFRRFGYITIMCNADNNTEKEKSILETMGEHSVDGILIIGGERNFAHIIGDEDISGIPLVLVDRETNNSDFTVVTLDNEYGGQLATDYLFSIGHKRIAYVTSDFTVAERLRLKGYIHEHRSRGIAVDSDLIISLDERQWHEGDVNSILRIFSLDPKPTALFASNDFKALQVLRLFKRNNIAVPDDISVMGFDDIELASIVLPALTTIHQPIDSMVELGARLLLDQVDGGSVVSEKQVLSPWLVERESTAHIL